MLFSIYIYSKNYSSIKKLETFFSSNFKTAKFIKIANKKQSKALTVLKSPHVNKTAQERFFTEYFKKVLQIKSNNPLLFLYFIKLIKNKLFLDVKLKVKIVNTNNLINKSSQNKCHPNNFNLGNSKKGLVNYLGLLDSYGKYTFL